MQGVQALFEQCQASMDPNSIAQLLAHHPYHIDALLAMFELYRYVLEMHPLQSLQEFSECQGRGL